MATSICIQVELIYSKSTIEKLVRDVKDFKIQQKRHQNNAIDVRLTSLLLTLNNFFTFC